MQEAPYRLTTLEELKQTLDANIEVMFDTETIGLYGKIRLAQFYQKGWEDALLVEFPNPIELAALLTGVTFVCHNAHYDITTIQANCGVAWAPGNYHCTFLLSRLYYYRQERFSLDRVVNYVLGTDPYDDEKKDMHGADWDRPVLTDAQYNYSANDVIFLQNVWDQVKTQTEDINYKLDILASKYALKFQNHGLPIDEERIQKRYHENLLRIEEIGLPVNCNSYQQVRAYIGSQQSDDLGLALLSFHGNEKASAVRETRKLTKNNSFLKKFLDTMEDGAVYGKFKFSARSGRSTSDDQNLQQIPRSLKGLFGVPTDGDEVMIFTDFAQIQLRAVCVVTGDTTMEKLFREGEDLHNYVAKMIFGENFTKRDRQICKTANFGLLFGAGIAVFKNILMKSADLYLSDDEAMKIKKKWLGLWRQIANWQNEGIRAWKKGQAWETPLGRRYKAKMMTDQLAMQIQGFEAEVAKLAMHYMLPKLEALDPSIRLRNFVHDSYIFTCVKDETVYKEACNIISDCMQEAWHEMCQSVKIPDLPMPVNVRVGYNWGDIESDEFIYEVNK